MIKDFYPESIENFQNSIIRTQIPKEKMGERLRHYIKADTWMANKT